MDETDDMRRLVNELRKDNEDLRFRNRLLRSVVRRMQRVLDELGMDHPDGRENWQKEPESAGARRG